jgi:flagellar motor protein MotB
LRILNTVAALILIVAGLAGPANANPDSGIDSNLFRPSLDSFGAFTVDSGRTLAAGDLSFKAAGGFGLTPLSLDVPGIADTAVLEFVAAIDLTAAFALSDWLTLAVSAGAYRTDTGPTYGERGRYDDVEPEPSTGLISLRPLSNIDPSGGFEPQGLAGPLDARVALKARLYAGDAVQLAAIAAASVPFGDEEMFLGDAGFVLEPSLALTWRPAPRLELLATAGARLRERTVLEAYDPAIMEPIDAQVVLDVGSELAGGLAAVQTLAPRLALVAETAVLAPLPAAASLGRCRRFSGARCAAISSADYFGDAGYGDLVHLVLAGVRVRASADVSLEAGLGGATTGARGEALRAWTSLVWQPGVEGSKSLSVTDSDGDGLGDAVDVCPDAPEDSDGYADDDGCPELDNDGDNVPDTSDECPDAAEDLDGWQDDDGCPDLDNDGDGIDDDADHCPNAAEDLDGYDDADGCPDPDNDGDGIADGDDACPDEPETVNGVDDTDGCPDQRIDSGPRVAGDRIDLRGTAIAFERGGKVVLTRASEVLLGQVAQLIRDRDLRVRVEVHVPRGRSARRDLRLSGDRATAIRAALLAAGAPAVNVRAVGLGSRRPIKQPPADPANERVDFILAVQRGGTP